MEQKDKQLIVFLAGELRSKERVRALLLQEKADLFAADGGYNYAKEFDLPLQLVFGDFGSSDWPNFENVIAYPREKDQTDSEIALDLAIERGYKNVWFIAPFGGRLDHTLANLALLQKAAAKGVELYLYDGENLAFLLSKGVHRLNGAYRYVSFLPTLSNTVVSLEGFKYPLKNQEIPRDSTLGISNEPICDQPIVMVHHGAVLCICIDENQEEI